MQLHYSVNLLYLLFYNTDFQKAETDPHHLSHCRSLDRLRQLVLHSKSQIMPSQPVITDRWAGNFDCCACRRKRLTADEFSKRVRSSCCRLRTSVLVVFGGLWTLTFDGNMLLWTSGWGFEETREVFAFRFSPVMKQR
jgi:hypothetical protein